MTNPTRAEIQAQNVDEIDKQIEALTEKRRELTRCWVSATRIADSESGHRKVEIQMRTRTISLILHDDADVIPAADLIPRAEHERAVELEALKTKAFMNIALQLHAAAQRVFGEDVIAEFQEDDYAPERIISMFEQAAQNPPMRDGRTPEGVWHDAVSCIISRFVDGDAAGEMSHIYKGREYRVTIERVGDDKPAEDAPVGCPQPKITAADAVAYLVKEYDTDTGHQDNAEPRTYRHTLRRHYKVTVHRAGDAVAPKGVVEELRREATRIRNGQCSSRESFARWLDHVAAQITELPEPSEWARDNVYIDGNGNLQIMGSTVFYGKRERLLAFAAALIEHAALLESEARDDHA